MDYDNVGGSPSDKAGCCRTYLSLERSPRARSFGYCERADLKADFGRLLRCRRALPPLARDLRSSDHGLGAAFDAELLQDRRHVRLDGRFRHPELVGDLLV